MTEKQMLALFYLLYFPTALMNLGGYDFGLGLVPEGLAIMLGAQADD